MANALIYAPSGGGKTVNTTLTKTGSRGKSLLICTDNSSIVLQNFQRPNLTVKNVGLVKDFIDEYKAACTAQKYDNIILDNLSDLLDMWLLELDESGKYKDFRQAYQLVYQSLKRLTRESAMADTNTIFTAWSDNAEINLPNGEKTLRLQPKVPPKILDNICGLMNIVGCVVKGEKDGKPIWYYALEGSANMIAKDQIFMRKSCLPENLFVKPEVKK